MVTLVVAGSFMVAGADPFAQLYAWLVGVGTVAVLLLQSATSVAVIAFFSRHKREEFHIWTTAIAPGLGALGLLAATWLTVDNWALLAGATDGIPVYLPWLVVVAGAVGLLWAFMTRDGGVSLATGFAETTLDESRALISGAAAPHTPDQPAH